MIEDIWILWCTGSVWYALVAFASFRVLCLLNAEDRILAAAWLWVLPALLWPLFWPIFGIVHLRTKS